MPANSDATSRLSSGSHVPPAFHRLDLGGWVVVFIFTIVPLAGITVTAFGGVSTTTRVASFSGTAIIGVLAGVMSWLVLGLYRQIPKSVAPAAAAFMAFFVAASGSIALGTTTRQGVQFLQVLIDAFGALALAAAARWSLGKCLDVTVGRCIRLTSIVLISAVFADGAGANIDISPRTSAIVALLGVAWFLAEYRAGHRRSLVWALTLVIAIAVSLSRTALFAGFIIVLLTFMFDARGGRTRNLVLAVALSGLGYWGVASWAPLHDRFFQGDLTISVGGVNINSEGRTHVWSVLWSEIPNDLLLGHGPGTASARSLQIDPAFDHPHNDYIRLLYDYGTVGTALLLWCFLRLDVGLRKITGHGTVAIPVRAARIAGLAVLIVMMTDNPLDYPYVMIPLGALFGLGLGSAPNNEQSPAVDEM